MQHTKRGPTQLRHLRRGSVVLFGSCIGLQRFVVDTVLVVDRHIDHGAGDYEEALEGAISETYRRVTIGPWYAGEHPLGRTFRLYFGATADQPVDGMFSFVPASTLADRPRGFARPAIELVDLITPHLTQGKRLNRDLAIERARAGWADVVAQVRAQGLELGVDLALPPAGRASRDTTGPPSGSC